jgi:hypothetical protein
MSENRLVGKIVEAVYLAKDKGAIRFDVRGGDPIIARADGDCCSHTWIEEVQGPEQLIEATVVSIEDVPMRDPVKNHKDYDSLQFYGCKITSDKGFCLIDYRNSSNGYYGGSLEWPVSDGEYDPFYGGVYGQNKSAMEWEKIA